MAVGQRFIRFGRYCMRSLGRPSRIRGVLGLKGAALKAHWFPPDEEPSAFPALVQALNDPSGLLAVGGQVTPKSLLSAFRAGIFVCYQTHQPAKWWAPSSRMVLFPEALHIQRTVQRLIRNDRFTISFDQAFPELVNACAYPRANSPENWILPLVDVYNALHRRGHAYSVEAWDRDGNLAGGVFGLVSGRLLSVESMFTRSNHASKIALAHLCAHLRCWNYPLIDMQMPTSHLESLGCTIIPRNEYMAIVTRSLSATGQPKPWTAEVKPSNDGTPIRLDHATDQEASQELPRRLDAAQAAVEPVASRSAPQ